MKLELNSPCVAVPVDSMVCMRRWGTSAPTRYLHDPEVTDYIARAGLAVFPMFLGGYWKSPF